MRLLAAISATKTPAKELAKRIIPSLAMDADNQNLANQFSAGGAESGFCKGWDEGFSAGGATSPVGISTLFPPPPPHPAKSTTNKTMRRFLKLAIEIPP